MQRLVLVSAVLVVTGVGVVALGRDADLRDASLALLNEAGRTLSLLADQLPGGIERAFNRSPVAVVAFAFGALLPIIGVTVVLLRGLGRAVSRLGRWLSAPAVAFETHAVAVTPGRTGTVWLDVGRDTPRRIALSGEMHRIGCDADCDIQIPGSAATGSQALIRRTPEREYHLIDISGRREPSVRINGTGAWMATLRDGDTIDVDGLQAIFRHGRVASVPADPSWPGTTRTVPPR